MKKETLDAIIDNPMSEEAFNEITSALRLQELVEETAKIHRKEYEKTQSTTSLSLALLLESLLDKSKKEGE